MTRVVVVGLDCVPPALAFGTFADVMPNLSLLARSGVAGPLRSCVPPITVPAWAAMLTGRDAGELGLYGFRNRVNGGYALRTADSRDVRVPWIWERLAQAGSSCAALFVPPTYPVRASPGTTLVSCLLTPGADRPHTHPAALADELRAAHGGYVPDVQDARRQDRARLLDELFALTSQHFAIARHVYRTQAPDFMVMVEIGPDRLHHAFYAGIDPRHPAHDPRDPLRDAGRRYYAHLDRELGELLAILDADTTVLVVSDHGARPLQGGICVNEWLLEHGYLVLREPPAGPTPPSSLAIDWSKTRAWAEGGYYARVCLNVQGREEHGCVRPERIQAERERVVELLSAIPGPHGERLEHRLLLPEQCFRAQNGRPPDVLAFLGDLDYRAIGSLGLGGLHVAGNDTGPDGCNHDWNGIFVLAGAGIDARASQEERSLFDVHATLLALFGVPGEADLLGRDLRPPAT
jgi:predicted AlkP superfamily phosphohydrolase/phosphomutase